MSKNGGTVTVIDKEYFNPLFVGDRLKQALEERKRKEKKKKAVKKAP